MNKKTGFIHLYTGDGKGMPYSEIEAINDFLPGISLRQYGLECFIKNKPTKKDILAARFGLSEVLKIITSGGFDLVILDEACIAVYYDLFTVHELISVIKAKPETLEVVITGRYAPAELIEFADLVTEMKEVRHYYQSGVEARKGIEY